MFKVAKNIGLLHRARQVLTGLLLFYIHLYWNYASIAWSSANVTKRYKTK